MGRFKIQIPLSDACQDRLLSVRKNGISCFTQVMVKSSAAEIQASLSISISEGGKLALRTQWLGLMLEKLDDLEKSVKEEAVGALSTHVIENLTKYCNHDMWKVLEHYPPGGFENFESDMAMLLEKLKSDEKLNAKMFYKSTWHNLKDSEGAFATAWILMRIIYGLNGEKRHFKAEEMYNFFQGLVGFF